MPAWVEVAGLSGSAGEHEGGAEEHALGAGGQDEVPGAGRVDEGAVGLDVEPGQRLAQTRETDNRRGPLAGQCLGVVARVEGVAEDAFGDTEPSERSGCRHGWGSVRIDCGSVRNLQHQLGEQLEMGIWTSDPALLAAARTWLLRLVEMSEPLEASWPMARLIVELPSRSIEKILNNREKSPAGTTTFSAGTTTSSRMTSADGIPRKPISRSGTLNETPGVSLSTTIAPIPPAPGASESRQ